MVDGQGRVNLGSVAKVGWWSLAVWAAAVAGALPIGANAAVGVLVGGGITLASLALHMRLTALWSRDRGHWSRRGYLWFLWLAKWPLIGLALWYFLARGYASPVWVCVGAAIVPAVATVIALVGTPRGARVGIERAANAGT